MSKKEEYDTSEDIRLGKNFHRAIQEEKASKESSEKSDKLARYFILLIILLLGISYFIFVYGGPK